MCQVFITSPEITSWCFITYVMGHVYILTYELMGKVSITSPEIMGHVSMISPRPIQSNIRDVRLCMCALSPHPPVTRKQTGMETS